MHLKSDDDAWTVIRLVVLSRKPHEHTSSGFEVKAA